jgi:hypothetical protein
MRDDEPRPVWMVTVFCILYSVICLRGNGVIRRTRKVIQGDDNGHVRRPW